MLLESKKTVEDIRLAAGRILEFVGGRSFADYANSDILQSAVERQFEIIGEALGRLARTDPDTASAIKHYQRIISFRNILIHGYAPARMLACLVFPSLVKLPPRGLEPLSHG